MSIKFLPCLHIAICCIEDHLTTSDRVMISFSCMVFILVNLRGLLYSYSVVIMSQEIAPEGSKLRVITNIKIFKILSSIYSIEILVIFPKLKKPQTWVSQKAA